VVVTGPTGSGKTTLLYALLSDINNQQLGVDMLVPFWYKKSVGIIDTLIDTSTLASLKLIFPSKMLM
jgi:Tfp pilus assembly pilus retraction ATPase PilT